MPPPSGDGGSRSTPVPVDHTRGIVASLFAPGPNGQPHPEQHIAHVQTFEGPVGTPARKARFLIISAVNDGRLKLHKAKENSNGTFSIGKTWGLEELRGIEVAKRLVDGMPTPQPLDFVLSMNGKTYRYETELPSSQQAAFLVKMVRCWRTYMQGRGVPDLVLIGFSVDNPAAPTSRSVTPSGQSSSRNGSASGPPPLSASSSSTHQTRSGSQSDAPPSRSFTPQSGNRPQDPRPSTAMSNRTVGSIYPPEPPIPTPPPSATQQGMGRRPSPAGPTPSSRVASPPLFQPNTFNSAPRGSSPGPGSHPTGPTSRSGSTSSISRGPPPMSSSQSQQRQSREPSIDSNVEMARRNGSASAPRPSSSLSQASNAPGVGSHDPAPGSRTKRPSSTGRGLPSSYGTSSSSAAPAPRQRVVSTDGPLGISYPGASSFNGPPSSSSMSAMPPSDPNQHPGSRPHHSTATVIHAPVPKRKMTAPEDLIDDDAVLSNVEEMLEGFEWRGAGGSSGSGMQERRGGKADEIEKRLVGELKALEAASIHAIMESDDRVTTVVKHLDDALAELDKLDLMIGLYKSQLNLMTDDIAHIESQNRGLQVQTSNQRMLLSELDNLLETIHIPDSDLVALSQESLESQTGIDRLEKAGVSLYKALLSTRDTAVGDMAAASERGGEYRQKASIFCKRVFDFLTVMFQYQVDQTLNPKDGKQKADSTPNHDMLEDFLGRYCGLMLFVKEIDQGRYQQICAAYFTSMSDLHRQEAQQLMGKLRNMVRKPTEEELEAGFSNTKESPTIRQQSMKRVGTVVRNPMEGKSARDQTGKIQGSEAFSRALVQIAPLVIREQGFIGDFLHINELDASITFADYMSLETFFRRGATNYLASQQGKLKDIRSAMEQVFGFLEGELRDWIGALVRADSIQLVGILAALDRAILVGEEERNEFLLRVVQKQYQRCLGDLERSIKEQIKAIEQTKLTLKKRKGVVPFVRIFPNFVARVEAQLEGAGELHIRDVVDGNYERIVATVFDSLQQMAKMAGEGQGVAAEDKDQLNYHVVMIENMHHIVSVVTKQNVPALRSFVQQARDKYTQNLNLYIKLVLRRPLARILDFFQGLEQLLRTTPPTEVSLHNAYTKSALRRVTSDVRVKDLRKAIDALYKRVDKHFGDVLNPSAEHTLVIRTVWKATEEELIRLTTVWKGLIEKCYPDDRVGLEFTRDDVHEIFSKAHVN